MKKNLVSVIMPAYNAELTLLESAISVLQQTHIALELIIIDDCSTDKTPEVALALSKQDPRVQIIRQQPNQGVAAARNAGIAAADGEYIAFLDSDDLWLPDKLTQQLTYMGEQDATICTSAYYRFRTPGEWLSTSTPPRVLDYSSLLKGNSLGNLTGIYNCRVLGKIFQKHVRHEDYLMWLELARKAGKIVGLNKPLAAYRVSETSLSANKVESALWTWNIYRKELSLSAWFSFYLMCHYVFKAIFKRL